MRILTLLALALVACSRAAASDEPTPTCVQSWPEARYRPYGYDHIVHIQNACATTAECIVTTNVNPERIPATVPPKAHVEVVTWVGSPAREFMPTVWCQLREKGTRP